MGTDCVKCVRIQSDCGKIRSRRTPNTDTSQAMVFEELSEFFSYCTHLNIIDFLQFNEEQFQAQLDSIKTEYFPDPIVSLQISIELKCHPVLPPKHELSDIFRTATLNQCVTNVSIILNSLDLF